MQEQRNKGMFGKLTLDTIPLQEPIVVVTLIGIILGGLAVVGALTYFRKWEMAMERMVNQC